jgi:hypothetical protein
MNEPIVPSLENLRKAEEENVGVMTRILGDTLTLVDDLRGLYDWLAAELCKPGGADRCPDVMPGIPLLRASEYHLHSAVLSCLRCHVTDSCAASRMAVESVAVLAKMQRQPEVARLWAEAGVDDQAAKAYRRATSGPELFPADDAELKELKRHYDLCAKQTHPGFASMVRRLRASTPSRPSQVEVEFHWFEDAGVPRYLCTSPARTRRQGFRLRPIRRPTAADGAPVHAVRLQGIPGGSLPRHRQALRHGRVDLRRSMRPRPGS